MQLLQTFCESQTRLRLWIRCCSDAVNRVFKQVFSGPAQERLGMCFSFCLHAFQRATNASIARVIIEFVLLLVLGGCHRLRMPILQSSFLRMQMRFFKNAASSLYCTCLRFQVLSLYVESFHRQRKPKFLRRSAQDCPCLKAFVRCFLEQSVVLGIDPVIRRVRCACRLINEGNARPNKSFCCWPSWLLRLAQ